MRSSSGNSNSIKKILAITVACLFLWESSITAFGAFDAVPKDLVRNARAMFEEAYSLSDDLWLQSVVSSVQERDILIESDPELKQYFSHAQLYGILKKRLLADLGPKFEDKRLVQNLLYSLRQNGIKTQKLSGLKETDFLSRQEFERKWEELSWLQQYERLSWVQDLFYEQALENAQETYALLSMYQSQDVFRIWSNKTFNELIQLFCEPSSKGANEISLSFEKDLRCPAISKKVMQRFTVRNFIPLEKAMYWISTKLLVANERLTKLKRLRLSGKKIKEQSFEYQEYLNAFAMAATGPGVAIHIEPLKSYVGEIRSVSELNDLNNLPDLHFTPSYFVEEKDYLANRIATLDSLKAAQKIITTRFQPIQQDALQREVDSREVYNSNADNFRGLQLITRRKKAIDNLVFQDQVSVAQVWKKNPELLYLVSDSIQRNVKKKKAEERRDFILKGGVILISGVLFFTGIGAVISAPILLKLALAGTILSMGEGALAFHQWMKKSHTHEQLMQAVMSQNGRQTLELRETYEKYVDAKVEFFIAVGSGLFEFATLGVFVTGLNKTDDAAKLILFLNRTIKRLRSPKFRELTKLFPEELLPEMEKIFRHLKKEQITELHTYLKQNNPYDEFIRIVQEQGIEDGRKFLIKTVDNFGPSIPEKIGETVHVLRFGKRAKYISWKAWKNLEPIEQKLLLNPFKAEGVSIDPLKLYAQGLDSSLEAIRKTYFKVSKRLGKEGYRDFFKEYKEYVALKKTPKEFKEHIQIIFTDQELGIRDFNNLTYKPTLLIGYSRDGGNAHGGLDAAEFLIHDLEHYYYSSKSYGDIFHEPPPETEGIVEIFFMFDDLSDPTFLRNTARFQHEIKNRISDRRNYWNALVENVGKTEDPHILEAFHILWNRWTHETPGNPWSLSWIKLRFNESSNSNIKVEIQKILEEDLTPEEDLLSGAGEALRKLRQELTDQHFMDAARIIYNQALENAHWLSL